MRTVRLTGQFVERVHDELIGFYFPNVEPVSARDHRDLAALEGALAAPFATAFGAEAFPTVQDKAARLFYGIAANHPFPNGNKRTALVAVDALCYANSFYLDMSSRTAVWGARLAASHNAKGIPHVEAYRRLARAFARDMVPFAEFKANNPAFHRDCLRVRRWVRTASRATSPTAITGR